MERTGVAQQPNTFSRADLLDAGDELLLAIRSGKLVYSEWKFSAGRRSFENLYLFYIVGGLFALACGFFAFVGVAEAGGPFLLFLFLMVMVHVNASDYEDLAYQFLVGRLRKASQQAPSVTDQLATLAMLRKDGAISESEYQALKQKVL